MKTDGEDISQAQAAALDLLANEISKGGKYRYDQIRNVFGLLGDKWSILILLVLLTGRMRHATLGRTLNRIAPQDNISQRILTLKLRKFEQQKLVERQVSDDVPARVDYGLTDAGRELTVLVRSLIDWLVLNHPAGDRA